MRALEDVLLVSDVSWIVRIDRLFTRICAMFSTTEGIDGVIYAAIHSAFVKYPREDDPASHDHWIQPEESAHLTRVVLAELEANGFQIVKKPA
jgi:hypothetical protein